jgi:hypothetical protein
MPLVDFERSHFSTNICVLCPVQAVTPKCLNLFSVSELPNPTCKSDVRKRIRGLQLRPEETKGLRSAALTEHDMAIAKGR